MSDIADDEALTIKAGTKYVMVDEAELTRLRDKSDEWIEEGRRLRNENAKLREELQATEASHETALEEWNEMRLERDKLREFYEAYEAADRGEDGAFERFTIARNALKETNE